MAIGRCMHVCMHGKESVVRSTWVRRTWACRLLIRKHKASIN